MRGVRHWEFDCLSFLSLHIDQSAFFHLENCNAAAMIGIGYLISVWVGYGRKSGCRWSNIEEISFLWLDIDVSIFFRLENGKLAAILFSMSGQCRYKSVFVPSGWSWDNTGIGVGISTQYSLQANIQFTSCLAVAILKLSLLVTFDSIDDMSIELSDLGNIGVAIGILTIHSLQVNIGVLPV